ncbi:winged helix-turn-helix transcriptional regulator [Jatrophihabitans sp.]|uniref:winged helix-turn-helix transcriptional regulator n=1 Tax=Jatrophihabitans sp. TaxID=1932789 RepID=UPI002C4023A1|nr:winged helix-turn-helix transcriptional regulator [Jatrophihabitans sp.]
MSRKRSYNEGCPVSHALDLVGERWGLLVVRELLLGPKRFADLRNALCGASSNILSTRLRDLAEIGVLRKRLADGPGGGPVYELTDWGRALEPVLFALGTWGTSSPFWDRQAPSTVDSLVLALRAQAEFVFLAGAPVAGTCQLRVDDSESFVLRFGETGLEVTRASAAQPDAVVDIESRTLQKLLTGDDTLDDAVDEGRAKLGGDERLIRSLIK